MTEYKNVRPSSTKLTAYAGSKRNGVMEEAIKYSIDNCVNVEFYFNSQHYFINHSDLMAQIKKMQ
jgi:hypothetical protein